MISLRSMWELRALLDATMHFSKRGDVLPFSNPQRVSRNLQRDARSQPTTAATREQDPQDTGRQHSPYSP